MLGICSTGSAPACTADESSCHAHALFEPSRNGTPGTRPLNARPAGVVQESASASGTFGIGPMSANQTRASPLPIANVLTHGIAAKRFSIAMKSVSERAWFHAKKFRNARLFSTFTSRRANARCAVQPSPGAIDDRSTTGPKRVR